MLSLKGFLKWLAKCWLVDELDANRSGVGGSLISRYPAGNVPVCVKNGGGMAPEEGHLIGELPSLIERNDGKGTATAGLPVHGEVFRVDLAGVSRDSLPAA